MTDEKLPVTVGTVTITEAEYTGRPDPEEPDYYPQFRITGRVRRADGDHDFVRLVAVELDGRDADHEHVSGLDLDEIDGNEGNQVTEDLYNAIYGTPAYRAAANAYHGE